MSVDNDPSFWKWVAGALLSAGGAVWGFLKYLDGRFDKKADKHTVNNQLSAITNEIGVLRGTQAKIFDQIRENEQRAQDRYERLMEQLK